MDDDEILHFSSDDDTVDMPEPSFDSCPSDFKLIVRYTFFFTGKIIFVFDSAAFGVIRNRLGS